MLLFSQMGALRTTRHEIRCQLVYHIHTSPNVMCYYKVVLRYGRISLQFILLDSIRANTFDLLGYIFIIRAK